MTFLRAMMKQVIGGSQLNVWRRLCQCLLAVVLMLGCLTVTSTPAALADINSDRFDGEIFALYGGNGSLVPPKISLEAALKRNRPVLLVLYVDDNSDSKQYTTVISQMQRFYGLATEIILVRVDSIPEQASYQPTEPGYYFKGYVPQTVVFDANGKVVLNEAGVLAFERLDDIFRELFDLLPRSESVELKRRQVNEITTELINPQDMKNRKQLRKEQQAQQAQQDTDK